MNEKYKIPDYVKEFFSPYLKKRKYIPRFYDRLAPCEVKTWCDTYPKVTLQYVFYALILNHECVPCYCENCGKYLDISILKKFRRRPKYCSVQCAHNKNTYEKHKQTCLERYGVDNIMHIPSTIEKIKKTCKEKYGVDNPNKAPEVANRRKETFLAKYGVDNYTKTDEFKNKVSTALKGRKQSKPHRDKLKLSFYSNFYEKYKQLILDKENLVLLSTQDEFVHNDTVKYKCLTCGHTWFDECTNSRYIRCPKCYPKGHNTSSGQSALKSFIESIFDGDIVENNRTILEYEENGKIRNYEMDLYIPSKRLAIEFDGNYWHSDVFNDKKYAQHKTLVAKNNGIRLIHINEYDWYNKREKVFNLIKSAIGIFDERIYARNCTVRQIESPMYRKFLDENHFDGAINSAIKFGLFDKSDRLVAVIGFGNSRFKRGEIELHRFCVLRGVLVVGALSKLIKHSGIDKFITFVDLSHFNGNGYLSCGFKVVENTQPNYVYSKQANIVMSRYQCQKHKLKDVLGERYDSSLTEYENMTRNGWRRIFDSGSLKLSYDANQ